MWVRLYCVYNFLTMNNQQTDVVLQGNSIIEPNEPATELTYLEFTQAFAKSKSYQAFTEGAPMPECIQAFIGVELKATLIKPSLTQLVFEVISNLYK